MKFTTVFICFFIGLNMIMAQTDQCKIDFLTGKELYENKDYKTAIKHYTDAINRSNYFHAIYGRAYCYYMLDENEKAINDLVDKRVENYYSSDTTYLFVKGRTYNRLEQWYNGYIHLKAAEDLNMRLYGNLGIDIGTSLYFLGRNEEALVYLIAYSGDEIKHSGAFTNMGWIYMESKDYELALASFLKANRIAANFESLDCQARTKNNLGFSYGLNGKYGKGISLIKKSIKMAPDNSFTYRNLSELYMKKNRKRKSCKYLQISLEKGILEEWGEKYIRDLVEYCKMIK